MLRPDTEKLWHRLRDERALDGFILVGGTALSMHLNHRLSEDLDFMYLGKKLPRERLDLLRRILAAEGIDLQSNDSPLGVEEFEQAGYDLRDFQQDFIASGTVKVTFVAPEPESARQLEPVSGPGPRVASLAEIFRLKCIVAADRSKTRDWFDLYLMLKQELFQPVDIFNAFVRSGAPSKFDIAMMRLCSGVPGVNDEGYESLMSDPPSIKDMRDYFIVVRREAEKAAARAAMPAPEAPAAGEVVGVSPENDAPTQPAAAEVGPTAKSKASRRRKI
ncbi:nucleotidyl transferase AbiEii/AbiGii toxin family protein [Hydrogenophaga sp. 2FB]|uniref:nucleotidyl transferase AbiEii/AbiGii toxin family protein n=1 Tax=Hydrogenophaga sp. 2FB TaxID=2502187 RepID=UPI0025A42D12|nr:nucleotidyl transferase AbiEii/AbiGii toxin family protein [Hydrogenophaga sp. 2FB]